MKKYILLLSILLIRQSIPAQNDWCGYCRDFNYNIKHKYNLKNWYQETLVDCKGGWLWPAYLPC